MRPLLRQFWINRYFRILCGTRTWKLRYTFLKYPVVHTNIALLHNMCNTKQTKNGHCTIFTVHRYVHNAAQYSMQGIGSCRKKLYLDFKLLDVAVYSTHVESAQSLWPFPEKSPLKNYIFLIYFKVDKKLVKLKKKRSFILDTLIL